MHTGVGYIDDITLESARPSRSGEEKINTVELCSCDDGYVGQFCESCAPGYSRNPPDGGPLAHCVIIGASLANSGNVLSNYFLSIVSLFLCVFKCMHCFERLLMLFRSDNNWSRLYHRL